MREILKSTLLEPHRRSGYSVGMSEFFYTASQRPEAYVGVSGVNNNAFLERPMQDWLEETFESAQGTQSVQPERKLLLGVKAVHKTQYLDIENKYGRDWYPVGADEFSTALHDYHNDSLRAAQVFFDPEYVHDPAYRQEFMHRINRRGATWLNALQFDLLPWHTDSSVASFLSELKERTGYAILLQVHGHAMAELGPRGVASALQNVASSTDYALFDASHGKGVRMNPRALVPFLDAVFDSSELDTVGFGVAGGLDAETVTSSLPSLLEQFPGLSWDAEGRLHAQDSSGRWQLDRNTTEAYIQASAEVLAQSPANGVG